MPKKKLKQRLNKPNLKVRQVVHRGKTPLHLASEAGHVNAKNYLKDTPLHIASANGNVEVVRMLLKNGADVNATNIQNKTPLDLASASGDNTVVEILRTPIDTND